MAGTAHLNGPSIFVIGHIELPNLTGLHISLRLACQDERLIGAVTQAALGGIGGFH